MKTTIDTLEDVVGISAENMMENQENIVLLTKRAEKAEAERDKFREALKKIGGHYEGNERIHYGNLQALVHHLVEIAQKVIKDGEQKRSYGK